MVLETLKKLFRKKEMKQPEVETLLISGLEYANLNETFDALYRAWNEGYATFEATYKPVQDPSGFGSGAGIVRLNEKFAAFRKNSGVSFNAIPLDENDATKGIVFNLVR